MPTYEYRCPQGHEFELFQRISEEPRAACPVCGSDAERKISGGAGFLFKGEGFYITDYRSSDYKKKASAETGGGGGESKGTGSSEGGSSGSGSSGSGSSDSGTPGPSSSDAG